MHEDPAWVFTEEYQRELATEASSERSSSMNVGAAASFEGWGASVSGSMDYAEQSSFSASTSMSSEESNEDDDVLVPSSMVMRGGCGTWFTGSFDC